jgi:IS5 family transposase
MTWSDVKLAEALDDRASYRRLCGFSADEARPERSAFVRFRRHLIDRSLDKTLFDKVTRHIGKGNYGQAGTLVDATVIAPASHEDGEAAWSKHAYRDTESAYRIGLKSLARRHVELHDEIADLDAMISAIVLSWHQTSSTPFAGTRSMRRLRNHATIRYPILTYLAQAAPDLLVALL